MKRLGFSFGLARWQKWLLVMVALGAVLWLIDCYRTWKENSQDPFILAASTRYGVDPALVKAVVWRESRFDPYARGRKGEVGLMQIMKDTGGEWAKATKRTLLIHTQLFDPTLNTDCGAWYLRRLLLRYPRTDNCVPYALADYNAGRGNVLKWLQGSAATNSAEFIEHIGFPSTREYVRSTMERYQRYLDQGFGRPPKSN